jgi:hypothetical protein
VLGFFAAVTVVWLTLRHEQRKRKDDLDSLRRSLAVELRILIPQALSAYKSLHTLASSQSITGRMVENFAYVQAPTVYPASASRIALLGNDAMQIVIIYSLLGVARAGAERLIRSRDADNLDGRTVKALAVAFLKACEQSLTILSVLKTDVPEHDQRDALLIRAIQEEALKANVPRS